MNVRSPEGLHSLDAFTADAEKVVNSKLIPIILGTTGAVAYLTGCGPSTVVEIAPTTSAQEVTEQPDQIIQVDLRADQYADRLTYYEQLGVGFSPRIEGVLSYGDIIPIEESNSPYKNVTLDQLIHTDEDGNKIPITAAHFYNPADNSYITKFIAWSTDPQTEPGTETTATGLEVGVQQNGDGTRQLVAKLDAQNERVEAGTMTTTVDQKLANLEIIDPIGIRLQLQGDVIETADGLVPVINFRNVNGPAVPTPSVEATKVATEEAEVVEEIPEHQQTVSLDQAPDWAQAQIEAAQAAGVEMTGAVYSDYWKGVVQLNEQNEISKLYIPEIGWVNITDQGFDPSKQTGVMMGDNYGAEDLALLDARSIHYISNPRIGSLNDIAELFELVDQAAGASGIVPINGTTESSEDTTGDTSKRIVIFSLGPNTLDGAQFDPTASNGKVLDDLYSAGWLPAMAYTTDIEQGLNSSIAIRVSTLGEDPSGSNPIITEIMLLSTDNSNTEFRMQSGLIEAIRLSQHAYDRNGQPYNEADAVNYNPRNSVNFYNNFNNNYVNGPFPKIVSSSSIR